jgi:uncharacterized peroxidase-related enzyme
MSLIQPLSITTAPEASQPLLEAVKAKMGKVPNLLGTMAHAPAVLSSYLAQSEALGGGALSGQEREIVALVVAEANACDYCLAAHTMIGGMQGLDSATMLAARSGKGGDEKLTRLVELSREITESRGNPAPATVKAFLASGWTQAHLLEVVAAVSLNTLTNYINHIAGTEVDFPAAPKLQTA